MKKRNWFLQKQIFNRRKNKSIINHLKRFNNKRKNQLLKLIHQLYQQSKKRRNMFNNTSNLVK
jgi:hypothetical protein